MAAAPGARLFSAMVAAWGESGHSDSGERSALEWPKKLEAPAIRCGRGCKRRMIAHYVPVNDATALTLTISGSYRDADRPTVMTRVGENAV